jgi:hypothetical protein
MSRRILSPEEQEILRKNPFVAACSDRSISFTGQFKQYAVRVYNQGKRSQDIFIEAGIPLEIIGRKTPKECLRRWRKKNETLLKSDGRGTHGKGGRTRKERIDLSKMTEQEKIEYLELRCAYLNAENDFLAQVRGIKRAPFQYRPGHDMK